MMRIPSNIAQLPKDVPYQRDWEAMISRYKTLRLTAVQLDPNAFSPGAYERESQFSDEIWASRIQDPRNRIFIALDEPNNNDIHVPTESLDCPQRLMRKNWLGLLGRLGPRFLPAGSDESEVFLSPWDLFLNPNTPSLLKVPDTSTAASFHAFFMLFGMFVLPEARGKGHGRKLVDAVLLAVREDLAKHRVAKATVILTVKVDNRAARRFYETLGFSLRTDPTPLDCGGRNEVVMAMEVDG